AYKACEVLRGLTEAGHTVRVVPTAAALHFVGAATWAALSGQPVASDVWDDAHEVPQVRIGREATLVLVVPATADLMAKAAHGLADDLLTSTLLTATGPVVFVPAMHTEMWEHAATRANVDLLRRRGVVVVEPAVGRLTGADSGKGRLPEPEAVLALVARLLARGSAGPDLAGRTVVVSAGGTREPIDPVRYVGNRSSGRQGYALALAAAARGAKVVLVSANVSLPEPAGVDVVRVSTAAELGVAVRAAAGSADAVVMAAAVADFRPSEVPVSKIKKGGGAPAPIVLEPTEDVLAGLVAARTRPEQVVVGFAAETGDADLSWLDHGRAKLAAKGCDLLVVNQVGDGIGFEVPDNAAVVLGADGSETEVTRGPKEALADVVWDLVAARLA
ncbi:MAG TPA: bifunctional phosphopantothenoylcysteine decarboxylase/phosphopantothenate--cysteine ligase CoaBC, partial [Actinomycetes bacterium]